MFLYRQIGRHSKTHTLTKVQQLICKIKKLQMGYIFYKLNQLIVIYIKIYSQGLLNETTDEVNLCHQSLNFVLFELYPKIIIHCLKYYISGEGEMISALQTYSLKHSHPAVNISHTVSCCLWKNYIFFFPLVC